MDEENLEWLALLREMDNDSIVERLIDMIDELLDTADRLGHEVDEANFMLEIEDPELMIEVE